MFDKCYRFACGGAQPCPERPLKAYIIFQFANTMKILTSNLVFFNMKCWGSSNSFVAQMTHHRVPIHPTYCPGGKPSDLLAIVNLERGNACHRLFLPSEIDVSRQVHAARQVLAKLGQVDLRRPTRVPRSKARINAQLRFLPRLLAGMQR